MPVVIAVVEFLFAEEYSIADILFPAQFSCGVKQFYEEFFRLFAVSKTAVVE